MTPIARGPRRATLTNLAPFPSDAGAGLAGHFPGVGFIAYAGALFGSARAPFPCAARLGRVTTATQRATVNDRRGQVWGGFRAAPLMLSGRCVASRDNIDIRARARRTGRGV